MFETICNMIDHAEEGGDYELEYMVYELISHLAMTINCPSNWRDIGKRLADKYRENVEIYDNFRLYNFDY